MLYNANDTTDEDGFAAARDLGGHGIRIGLTGGSVADYRLPDPRAARRFLSDIIRRLEQTPKRKNHADT